MPKHILQITVIIFLIGLGVWLRFADLGGHFTHIDDVGVLRSLMDAKHSGSTDPFVVSRFWTYAPFQFLFTPFFISFDQSYRELLFWLRFPSAFFGSLGLFILVFFYFFYDKLRSSRVVLSLTLLACSLESVVFAKQAHNYALGVTAVLMLLTLFVFNVKQRRLTWLISVVNGLMLGLFTFMHYGLLFFTPSFYLILFIKGIKRVENKWVFILKFFISGFVYIGAVIPMWLSFIKPYVERTGHVGLSWWNKAGGQFVFQIPQEASFWEQCHYTAVFYGKNFFYIFQANIGFFPEDHVLFNWLTGALFLFFLFGCVSYFRTRSLIKRSLGQFFLVLMIVWIGLVVAQRLTFSPTRHSLNLLPFIIITITEGVVFLFGLMKNFLKCSFRLQIRAFSVYLISIVIISFSMFYASKFFEERRDPFQEEEIMSLIEYNNVDTVIVDNAAQVELMKSIREYFDYYMIGFKASAVISKGPTKYKTVMWISHLRPLTPDVFEESRASANRYIYFSNGLRVQEGKDPLSFWNLPWFAYRVVFSKVIETNVEIEFSRRTGYEPKKMYLYVLTLRDK